MPPNHVVGSTDPVPLVFDFHGLIEGSDGTHPFATQFSAKANEEGFAVAFPVGVNDGLNWDISLMPMCVRANTFAEAAPVTGLRNLCTPTEREVPFVTFHGTTDPTLPDEWFADVPHAMATGYGCVTTPAVAVLWPDPDPGTGGTVERLAWDCSAVGSAAEFYRIGGGGHSWPGSWFFSLIGVVVGPTTTTLDARRSTVIWDFFREHQLADMSA